MMRRTIAGVVLATSLAVTAFSNAQASGYPVLSIVDRSGSTYLVVGCFDNDSFSFQQADSCAALIVGLLAGYSAENYTPSQLAAFGYYDAIALMNMLYASYQSMGFTAMIYYNITRVACFAGSVYGVSDRIDVYVADLRVLSSGVLPGDYVASFEFPEGYLALLSRL